MCSLRDENRRTVSLRLFDTAARSLVDFQSTRPRPRRPLHVRPDRLQPGPHREPEDVRLGGRDVPGVPEPRPLGDAGDEPDRHRRQDDPRAPSPRGSRSGNSPTGTSRPSSRIYAGSGNEFAGPPESTVNHWSCYSFAHDTLRREWRITPPAGFEFYYYHTNRNALVGITRGLTVKLFNCEAAAITDSFTYGRSMGDKRFLLAPGIDLPDLFGRVYDTVYVYRLDAVTDINSPDEYNLPTDYALAQNYPNPFNPTTRIRFSIPRAGDVRLDVFNIAGQRVATLIDARLNAGDHDVSFDAHNLASGIYLYRLTAEEYTATRKMVLVK